MNASIQAHTSELSARPHACAVCGRRFVVVGVGRGAEPRCVCGGALAESGLAGGVYELRSAARAPKAKATPKRSPKAVPPLPKEPDLGYGESHGYGPAHGGPSGPGDAPATEAPEGSPAPEKPASSPRHPS